MAEPSSDIRAEARRIADAASAGRLALGLIGGVGIAMRCPSSSSPPLERAYADIDVVGLSGETDRISGLFNELGYQADTAFNTLHGHRRLYFWDPVNSRQVDVFLDEFEMCHTLELRDRIAVDQLTLPLADLLLMKLQIMETNEKDFIDILALLIDHQFTDDDTGIDLTYLARLAGSDWGLWKTTTTVAERADAFARRLGGVDAARVHDQVGIYLTALDECPKSRGWRMRAKVGERKRWYALPEEVG
jgi:hypothetical protein